MARWKWLRTLSIYSFLALFTKIVFSWIEDYFHFRYFIRKWLRLMSLLKLSNFKRWLILWLGHYKLDATVGVGLIFTIWILGRSRMLLGYYLKNAICLLHLCSTWFFDVVHYLAVIQIFDFCVHSVGYWRDWN